MSFGPITLGHYLSLGGLLFALSEFIVAWLIAFLYSRHASRHFDAMAADIGRIANGERT